MSTIFYGNESPQEILTRRKESSSGPETMVGAGEKMTLVIDINSDMVDAINGRLSDTDVSAAPKVTADQWTANGPTMATPTTTTTTRTTWQCRLYT